MEHFLEILKIVDGAMNADRGKVLAYGEQLAAKLEAGGDPRSAAGLRRTLERGRTLDLMTSRMGSLPVDGESRLALADETLPTTSETFVILEPNAERRVQEFVQYVRASDALLREGVGIAPSLLLAGPPGCGKTALARRVAAELALPLLTARTDTLISSFLGSTAKNIRLLFEHAMGRPCVLFLDEFDALAKLRDDRHELGELKRVVVSLLQNIDALDNKTVLLAATNHEHLLDNAIWRRFAFHLRLDLPGSDAREALFQHFIGDHLPADVQPIALARVCAGMTGADIRNLCEDARRAAIVGGCRQVDRVDLLRRIVGVRLPAIDGLPLAKQLAETQALDRKLFTIRVLHELFGTSTGKISQLLRSKGGR